MSALPLGGNAAKLDTHSAAAFNNLVQGRHNPVANSGAAAAAPAAYKGTYGQNQPVTQTPAMAQPTPPPPAAATPAALGPATISFGSHDTFKWKNGNSDNDNVVEVKPLLGALQHQNLSTNEQFNIAGTYVESAKNISDSPLGVQFLAVNGRDVKNKYHKDGSWSTIVVGPRESRDFSMLNGGKGLLIASNPLDDYGNVNVQMSPGDLLASAKKHTDGKKYVVDVDLTGFANRNASLEEQLQPMSQLGKIVYANAKMAFNSYPGIEQMIGGPLPPLSQSDVSGTPLFPDIKVVPDLLSDTPGRFHAVIPADQLTDAVEHYGKAVVKNAQPTSAHQHAIRVFRIGTKNGQKIGDISNELGITQGDIDRSKVQWSGLHLVTNYDIQHNGKKFTESSE